MKAHIIDESPLLKKRHDRCALCGKECLLTFEHIPPRAANNSMPAKPVLGDAYFRKNNRLPWDFSGIKFENQQKGMGLYSLCSECNNITGSYYGNDYCEFVKRANSIMKDNNYEKYHRVQILNIYPLRIIKQICSMFCSINSDVSYLDNMRKFVLDKNSNCFDKNKFRILMYFNNGNRIKYNGYSCIVDLNDSSVIKMSELVVPPFIFQLILDPSNEMQSDGIDISYFADYKYDDMSDVSMPIVTKEVNSIFPSDYRTKNEIIAQIEKSEKFIKENEDGTI